MPFFFLSGRVVNLFQELKPKCSHRDFEKGEAAEHNSKKMSFERAMHILGAPNSFLSILFIPPPWHLYFCQKLAAIFFSTKMKLVLADKLTVPVNYCVTHEIYFSLQVIFTQILFNQFRKKLFYDATAAAIYFAPAGSIYWANKDIHTLNTRSYFFI